MSRATPLVYVAASAQVRARQLIPGCVENEVAAAITAGSLRFDAGIATITGDSWQATARRTPGELRPSRAPGRSPTSSPHNTDKRREE